MTREKGVDLAVEALAQLGRPDVSLSLIGDGPEKRTAQALARTLGCSDQLSWHGGVPNAGRYLEAFEALIISSRTEGTPMVLFEAMAAGVPVVATSVGGIPDVVSTDTALLVPPEKPKELSGAILEVIRHPGRATEMAARARERLDKRLRDRPLVTAHEELYGCTPDPPSPGFSG